MTAACERSPSVTPEVAGSISTRNTSVFSTIASDTSGTVSVAVRAPAGIVSVPGPMPAKSVPASAELLRRVQRKLTGSLVEPCRSTTMRTEPSLSVAT
jgi:hypothetical protein